MLSCAALAGCASPSLDGMFEPTGPTADPDLVEAAAVPEVEAAPPPPPPPNANTASEFDTTTQEDREEALAVAPEPATEQELGTTIATLGAPADPGIWLKTPLVTEVQEGRVDYQGSSINLELRPSGGEAGSGSQISLPAMRLLNAPLTGIIELTVYSG